MSGIIYKMKYGIITPIYEDSWPHSDRSIVVLAKNAQAIGKLDERATLASHDIAIRYGVVEASRFNLSVALSSIQAEDSALEDPQFRYIAEGSAMACRIDVAIGCLVDAHITWKRPQSTGRKKQDAPMLAGTVFATLTPPMGREQVVGKGPRYDPISNRIRFG